MLLFHRRTLYWMVAGIASAGALILAYRYLKQEEQHIDRSGPVKPAHTEPKKASKADIPSKIAPKTQSHISSVQSLREPKLHSMFISLLQASAVRIHTAIEPPPRSARPMITIAAACVCGYMRNIDPCMIISDVMGFIFSHHSSDTLCHSPHS